MPDERLDSMQQGIAPAPESPEAKRADEERRAENVRNPLEMESAMGGTSDAEGAGDAASLDAALRVGLADDATRQTGSADDAGGADQQARTVQETREAGLRAQGGGSSDEGDIRKASGPGRR